MQAQQNLFISSNKKMNIGHAFNSAESNYLKIQKDYFQSNAYKLELTKQAIFVSQVRTDLLD